MWRELSVLLAIGVACTVIGAAASLGFSSGSIGAAALSVPRCTNAGLRVIQNLSGSNVVSVTISALPAGCGNAAAQGTVFNGTTNSSGSATVPAGGGSVTITLGAAVAASTVERIDLLLTGP